jgi:hypothetical protein
LTKYTEYARILPELRFSKMWYFKAMSENTGFASTDSIFDFFGKLVVSEELKKRNSRDPFRSAQVSPTEETIAY